MTIARPNKNKDKILNKTASPQSQSGKDPTRKAAVKNF
jgi:hypothetical protein